MSDTRTFGDSFVREKQLLPQAHVPEYKVTDVRVTSIETESSRSVTDPIAADGGGENDNRVSNSTNDTTK